MKGLEIEFESENCFCNFSAPVQAKSSNTFIYKQNIQTERKYLYKSCSAHTVTENEYSTLTK